MDSARILLVEGDDVTRRHLHRMLAGVAPYTTVEDAPGLASALEALPRARYDCILINNVLRDGTGQDFLAELEATEFLAPPVIVYSLLSERSIAALLLEEGAEDVLIRPELNADSLERAVSYGVRRHRVKRALDETNVRLERLSMHDPLTELLNRRGLQRHLTREISRARREGSPLLVLLIDLDDFKAINTRFGYARGDMVLREVARTLRTSLRPTDFIARVGGDEFLVLLPQTRVAEGGLIAERVRSALESLEVSGRGAGAAQLSASLAVGEVPNDARQIDDLFKRTDRALQAGKVGGKNRVIVQTGEAAPVTEEPVDAPDTSSGGDSGGEDGPPDTTDYAVIEPVYQLDDERHVGFEVIGGDTGPFNTADFARAPDTDEQVASDFSRFKTCTDASLRVGIDLRCYVTLLPETLTHLSPSMILDALPKGRPRDSFCVQLSEHHVIGDPSYLLEGVTALRREGVLIGIDDVGFGKGSLETLILIEPDVVVLERTLVQGISIAPAKHQTVSRLLAVARALGAEVLARGIDDPGDLEALRNMNVRFGQGRVLERASG